MAKALYFTPAAPGGDFAISKMMHLAGIDRIGVDHPARSANSPVMLWRGETTFSSDLSHEKPRINFRCTDISKNKVARSFSESFKYSLEVDPYHYDGLIVEKSDDNAAHDGRVLTGPINYTTPGAVYQVLADSVDKDGHVTDLRISIVGKEMPLVYIKKRPVEARFSNKNTIVTWAETNDIFSASEQRSISRFCRKMGLDYGELDVIRDKTSNKIYIVDANRTPVGPPNGLPHSDGIAALRRMAASFDKQFFVGLYWQ